jgi:apolipoprotein N-acyltransferase
LETGRYLLRATNTGISAIVNPQGDVVARAPQIEVYVQTATVQPGQGLTPYSRWEDWAVVMLLVLSLVAAFVSISKTHDNGFTNDV